MSSPAPDLRSVLSPVIGLSRTQYLELIRQPIYGVVLAFGLALVALSPALAVFSLGKAEALVLDLGASALLFFAVLLAAVAVGPNAAERLRDGTTALVLTHPVGVFTCLVGQLLGALAALTQAGLLLSFVLLWAVRNGADTLHKGVLFPSLLALGLALAWGVRASLEQRSFQASAIWAATLLFPPAYYLSTWLGPEGAALVQRADGSDTAWAAASLAVLAALPFAALSLALATRLGAAATATLTLLVFLLSSLVQGPLAPPEAVETIWNAIDPRWLTVLLPDLQLHWVGDAGYSETPVPIDYVAQVAMACCLYALGALGLGAFLLEGRELGGTT